MAEDRTETGKGAAFRAKHRFAPTSAHKARYAVDLVRGLPVNEAMERLQYSPRRSAFLVGKVLRSAIANAGQDLDVDANRLYVSDARADDGPTEKRGKARSRGQFFGILVRHCHISIEVREMPEGGLPGRRRRVRGAGRKGAAAVNSKEA
ncbi:MAG: 50S ribosomal protein L22 [Planctomycetaceae bacterium]|nr:50S ribosomal protein L22 [Planctomycetaceae bacterium]